MNETRLLLVALPTMLQDIIRQAIAGQPGLRIIEERTTLFGLNEAIRAMRPHVLVVGSERGELPPECEQLMYDHPHPGMLCVSRDGCAALGYRLRPQVVPLAEVSAAGVIDAIRVLRGDGDDAMVSP